MYLVFTHDRDGNKIRYLSTSKTKAKQLLSELCGLYGEAEMIPLKNNKQGIFELKEVIQ